MLFLLGFLAGSLVSPLTGSREVRPAAAATEPAPVHLAAAAGHPAEVLRVIDGDTFEARVQVWPGLAVTTKVRLRGIDAPELRARCRDEAGKAEAARIALANLLAEGGIGIAHVTLDKYGGRVVADASTHRTSNVSQALLAAGVARAYNGGRRESWCHHMSD